MLAIGNGELIYAIVWLFFASGFLVLAAAVAFSMVTGATWAAKISNAFTWIKSLFSKTE